jgi:hypothetical protein
MFGHALDPHRFGHGIVMTSCLFDEEIHALAFGGTLW